MPDRYHIYYNNDRHEPSFKILEALVSETDDFVIDSEFNEFTLDVYALLDQPASSIVSIDWDNTFTAYPEFYNELIHRYIHAGFKPIICTLRGSEEEDVREICEAVETGKVEICPTNGEHKRAYIQKNKGFSINLWIDDFFPGIAKCESKFITNNGIEILHF